MTPATKKQGTGNRGFIDNLTARMRRSSPYQSQAAVLDTAPDLSLDTFKDILWPDVGTSPDEPPSAFRLRCAFTNAGYRVRNVEEVKTHPVLIIRAVRECARRTTDHRAFWRHIRDVLRQAGFKLKRAELTVDQTGDRILVAFQSRTWKPNFEEILREHHENLADDLDMPL